MKKLLSVFFIFGVSVFSAAFADPTVEDRRELCRLLEEKGTHIWVAKNAACIPINACKDVDSDVQSIYCARIFNDVFVGDAAKAGKLVTDYLANVKKIQALETIESKWDSDRVIGIKTADENYITFSFTPLAVFSRGTEPEGILKGSCIVFGKYDDRIETGPDKKKIVFCTPIKDQQTCDNIADYASEMAVHYVVRELVDGNLCKLQYE